MRKIRDRLTYANVMSSLAVFLVLGGATAFAATQLPKNSVGTKQLKKNAVKSNKIAAKAVKTNDIAAKAVKTGKIGGEAVKAGKLAKNAIATDRLRDGAVTGAKIDAPSTPFGQIVASLGGNATVPFEPAALYPLSASTYTQPAGRVDQYLGSIDVNFPASCEPPRNAIAYLQVDADDPKSPLPQDYVGWAVIADTSEGDVSVRGEFGPFPGAGASFGAAPDVDTPHTFTVRFEGAGCKSGSGVTVTGVNIDVVGTK